MSLKVVTVAAGGIAVVDVTVTFPRLGMPVIEAPAGHGGIAVTKVTSPRQGLAVIYRTAPEPAEGEP